MAAIQKLHTSDMQVESDELSKAKKILVKCANALISKQELSAPQVASYLLNLDDYFTSHKHRPLFWTSFESYVMHNLSVNNTSEMIDCQETTSVEEQETDYTKTLTHNYDEVIIERNDQGFLRSVGNQVMDYIHRGPEFQDLCVWEFVAKVNKICIDDFNKADQTDDLDVDQMESDDDIDAKEGSHLLNMKSGRKRNVRGFLSAEHPQFDTHMLRMRNANARCIPVPIGPKIYRRDQEETYEEYCRLMLILFKPWSAVSDLVTPNESWLSAFERSKSDISSSHMKIIDNIQRLHECKDSRDEHFAKRHRNSNREMTYELTRFNTHTDLNLQNYDEDEVSNVIHHFDDIDATFSKRNYTDELEANAAIQAATSGGLFSVHDSEGDRNNESFNDLSVWTPATIIDGISETDKLEKDWEEWYAMRKRRFKATLTNDSISSHYVPSAQDAEQFLPSLSSNSQACDPVLPTAIPGDTEMQTDEDYNAESEKSISETISKFTLNKEQAYAFRIVAEHSLKRKEVNTAPLEPISLYLGGPGGTGKSRVIHALKSFFALKGEDKRLRLSSFMGVAAHNICGMTLHSLLSLSSLRNKKNSNKTKQELISTWAGVDYLFIDEISMVGCQLLSDISEALSIAKQRTDEPFGGISIIFSGDFCQLRPVGDKSLYDTFDNVYINPSGEQTSSGQKKAKGRLLWLELTHCIILNEQMRQSGRANAHFRSLLDRLRMGRCTLEDYDLLNTRLMSRLDLHEVVRWQGAPIITNQNAVKDALNKKCCQSFAERTNRSLHWYHAKDYHKRSLVRNAELKDALFDLHSGRTNQAMGKLPLIEGMPVIVTHNFDVSGGVVNGTRGTLKSVRYEEDDDGNRNAISCVVIVDAVYDTSERTPHLEDNEIVVLQESTSFTVENPYTHSKMIIHRKQLPLLPTYAITDFKSQGQTLSRVIVDLKNCRGSQSPYVMLSRAKSLNDIIILRPYDFSKICCRLSQSLRNELDRLSRIHDYTVSKLTEHGVRKKIAPNQPLNTFGRSTARMHTDSLNDLKRSLDIDNDDADTTTTSINSKRHRTAST